MEGSKAEFCVGHKKAGMVNVRTKRCGRQGCSKVPSFGVVGSKAEFCFAHKTDVMVNVTKTKRCAHPGCGKHPSFGVDGSKKREFCNEHKKPGMVYVKSDRYAHHGEHCSEDKKVAKRRQR